MFDTAETGAPVKQEEDLVTNNVHRRYIEEG